MWLYLLCTDTFVCLPPIGVCHIIDHCFFGQFVIFDMLEQTRRKSLALYDIIVEDDRAQRYSERLHRASRLWTRGHRSAQSSQGHPLDQRSRIEI